MLALTARRHRHLGGLCNIGLVGLKLMLAFALRYGHPLRVQALLVHLCSTQAAPRLFSDSLCTPEGARLRVLARDLHLVRNVKVLLS